MAQFLEDAQVASTVDDTEESRAVESGETIVITLEVSDPESVAELKQRENGEPRQQFALTALRLGVIALRQAAGAVDVVTLRSEAEKLIGQVDKLVTGNVNGLATRLATELSAYFDPSSGKLSERLNRLVHKDGELSRLLAEHLDGETSRLARTLANHVGAASPIMQMLSPQQKDGLLARVQQSIGEALTKQAELILKQFSLDDRQSALSKCLEQLTDSNGKLRKDLAADVEAVKKEFSLNNESGALSQLVKRVELANKAISDQFSFDNEHSAINKLSKQIRELVEESTRFHEEVRRTLDALKARREEAARGTRHGVEFEVLVGDVITPQVQSAGDVIERVGNTTGLISRCKKGDAVITLGPESSAPGGRVVIECKEVAGFGEAAALAELEEARPNRGAQVGLFVFSKSTAPAGQAPVRRVGNDVLCVWDKDDPASDVILTAALSIARALVIRQKVEDARRTTELAEIEDAINRIEKSAAKLDDIDKWAKTIVSNGQNIAAHAQSMRGEIAKRVDVLRQAVEALRTDETQA